MSTPVKLAVVVVGLAAALTLMALAFAAPSVNSGASDLPLAVSGPDAAVTGLTTTLEESSPGAFDVTVYESAQEVTDAIEDRAAIGGITLSDNGVTIVTATAAGTPYANLLKGVGTALTTAGQTVGYQEVAPFTEDDPAGSGLTAMALPLIFGGMISAVVLSVILKGISLGLRLVTAALFAIVAAFVVTAVLQFGFGSLDGSYWLTSLTVALGIAAISLTILGLESLLGYAGVGIGAVLMMFVANPLAGFATGPQWLPSPWGTIGQLLPVGAAGTAIRSMAFFDGGGVTRSLIVLVCWTILGLGLAALSLRRTTPSTNNV